MSKSKYVFYIARLLIILCLFQNYVKNILTISIIIIAFSMIFIFKEYSLNPDWNSKLIALFILAAGVSLIINLKNYSMIANSFYIKTGQFTSNMYIKITINVVIWFILVCFFYKFGKVISDNEYELNKFMIFIMNVFFVNGLINIFVWFNETGGIISRYNFVSPITNTPSAGIELSILGFFLSIGIPNKSKIVSLIYRVVFVANILIIVTRQQQIFFLIYLAYYGLIVFGKFKEKRIYVIIASTLFFIFVIISARYLVSTYINYYVNVFNTEGMDVLTRKVAHISALNLFYDSPIVGIGYGMFGALNTDGLNGIILNSAHSGFYSILSEFGILGVILTIILFINILVVTHNILKNSKGIKEMDIVYVIFLRSIIVLFFISNFILFPPPSERTYYLYGSIMWIFWGICNSKLNNVYKHDVMKSM